MALSYFLQKEYYVASMDFQMFGSADFETEERFAYSFASSFTEALELNSLNMTQ